MGLTRTLMMSKVAAMNDQIRHRSAEAVLVRGEGDSPKRLEIVAATDAPVRFWGADEVLSMKRGAVDLTRLRNNAPFLANHTNSIDSILGKVLKSRVEGGELRVDVELDTTEAAEDYAGRVERGMAGKISVGFQIEEMELTRAADEENRALYTITRWTPVEVSAVAVPADDGAAVKAMRQRLLGETRMKDDNASQPAAPAAPTVNTAALREEVVAQERARVAELTEYGSRFERLDGPGLANDVIKNGGSLDDLKTVIWAANEKDYEQRAAANKAAGHESGATGDGKETFSDRDIAGFSLHRALGDVLESGTNPNHDSHEMQVMRAANARIRRDNVRPNMASAFSIPPEALRHRVVEAGTGAGANLVAENLLESAFIALLRPRSVLMGRATMLADQAGDVEIPRQTATVNPAWRAEDAAATAVGDPDTDQIELKPKELIVGTTTSRKFLQQATPDGEQFIRNDLAAAGALAVDFAGLIGGGTNGPLGIVRRVAAGAAGLSSQFAGSEWAWRDVVDAESEVDVANALMGDLAYIMNARLRGTFKTTRKDAGSGMFLIDGMETNGYPVLVSNQIEDDFGYASNKVTYTNAGTKAAFIFGNLRDVLIATWYGIDIVVNPYSAQMQNRITISYHATADVNLRHLESFHVKVAK